ncbi:MAG: hypothetical protein H7274_01835 [Rhodoferax sp.]|nr:hypothetical protein [Rhodoferax sp.]
MKGGGGDAGAEGSEGSEGSEGAEGSEGYGGTDTGPDPFGGVQKKVDHRGNGSDPVFTWAEVMNPCS